MNFVFDNVSVVFEGVPALQSVSFTLQNGGGVLLTGASGAGKTTLLRLLYAACAPAKGTLLINGIPSGEFRGKKLRKLRSKMGVVFQDARLVSAFTVYENVMAPLIIQGHTKRAADSRCLDVMSDLGISYLREKYPVNLSGGERQLVALARALVAYPDCIIADEPTAQLDSGSVERIVQALMREHARGATLIVATHDEQVVHRFSGVGRLHLNEGSVEHSVEPVTDIINRAPTEIYLQTIEQSAPAPQSIQTNPSDNRQEHQSAPVDVNQAATGDITLPASDDANALAREDANALATRGTNDTADTSAHAGTVESPMIREVVAVSEMGSVAGTTNVEESR